MKHITEAQLLSWIDGHVEHHEAAQFEAHVSGCSRCAQELALHRAVTHSVKESPTPLPSPAFTGNLLARIGVQHRTIWRYFLDNAANIFAMGIVISLIGFILGPASIGSSIAHDYSSLEGALRLIRTASHWMVQILDHEIVRLTILITISTLLLILFDLFIGKRILRTQK